MILTEKERKKLVDTITHSLHVIGYLNDCETENEHNNQAISDLIIDITTLLQKINNADIVSEEEEYIF